MTTATDTRTIRQTHLRFLVESCPAGAHALAVEGREGPHSLGATRGTAVHEVFARYVTHLFTSGRQTDFEAASHIGREVVDETPELDYEARVDVLDQAARIGEGWLMDGEHYYGSEEPLETHLEVLGVGTVRITGRVDLVEYDQAAGVVRITDAKSNHQLPPDATVQRDFQLMTYALLALDTIPGLTAVEGQLWFTRYNKRLPRTGPAVWTPEELEEHRACLISKLAALYDGRASRQFVPGSHCQYCPRRKPGDCARWRSYSDTTPPALTTYYQARKAAARVIALEQEREVLTALLKDYANEHGPVRVGDTTKAELFGFRVTESEEIDAAGFLQVIRERESEFGPWLGYLSMLKVNKQAKGFKGLAKQLGAALEDVTTMKPSTRFTHWAEGGDDD